jgi:hypothetical protein
MARLVLILVIGVVHLFKAGTPERAPVCGDGCAETTGQTLAEEELLYAETWPWFRRHR